jgi:AhpC/TSA family
MRNFNWQIWVGLIICIFAFGSFPLIFGQLSLTRDAPWISFIFFAVGLIFVVIGLRRAFAVGRGKLSKVSASLLAVFSMLALVFFIFAAYVASTWLPKSSGAPQVGQKAPDFSLADSSGKQVSLSALLTDKKKVLLVFYRGYW